MSERQLIYKHDFPLLVSHSANDCEVLMLQPIRLVPETCTQWTVELKETLRITLTENSWIEVEPSPDKTIKWPA
jgi:hypothetical protein